MRLVSPGTLAGAEKLVFDNLKPWFPSQGVCVNVMLGQDPWDIRPLILVNNQVSLYRFSRLLAAKSLSNLAAEMQGFAVIPGWKMEIDARGEAERLVMIRPVYPRTLEEELAQEGGIGAQRRQKLVQQLIDVVRELRQRSLVHGHISPANIVDVDGSLILLDPCLGALHYSKDSFLAPEITGGGELEPTADLYGLGAVLARLIGENATHEQDLLLKRLLLPSPRQRPSMADIERAFVPQRVGNSAASGSSLKGRVLSRPDGAPATVPVEEDAPRPRKGTNVLPFLVFGLMGVGIFVKFQYPWLFNEAFRSVPLLVAPENTEYALAWASNDKERMKIVAEAAIRRHELAAENVILDDTLQGENRPGVLSKLLRVALSDLWRDQLSRQDQRAALALSLVAFYPDSVKELPPVSSLHPGILLAIAGQSQAKNPSKQLVDIDIDRLITLPDPVGDLFSKLKATGSRHVGDPEVIALAGIISGDPPPETLEAYIGGDIPVAASLARIAIALPLLAAREPAADQILVALRDKGGEIGQTLGWFDIDGLDVWSKVPSSDKLRLLLGELPNRELGLQHYADLLTFPLAEVRAKSAGVMRSKYLKGESENVVLALSGDQNRLTREQTVALLAALNLDVSKRAPFIGVFLQLNPSPDMILLVLLARNNKDSTDLFNLEASRYLRKTEWSASTEMLRLLSHHPEPLARSLAYARLSTKDPEQKKILEQRISEEGDQGLLKGIMQKLSGSPPSSSPDSTSSPTPAPPR